MTREQLEDQLEVLLDRRRRVDEKWLYDLLTRMIDGTLDAIGRRSLLVPAVRS